MLLRGLFLHDVGSIVGQKTIEHKAFHRIKNECRSSKPSKDYTESHEFPIWDEDSKF